MSIAEKLGQIQTTIKAPKNLYNSFGNYKYRNAEGIFEAVKPYLDQYKCHLVLEDNMVEIGGRIYVKATATLYDNESKDSVSAAAFAREAESKKGMDDSQVTGTASSYARKYALNGLFLLDDTKDADSDEYHKQNGSGKDAEVEKKKTETAKISGVKVKSLVERCKNDGIDISKITKLYKVNCLEDLNEIQFRNINDHGEEIKKV